ncbi:MAG TPA: plastocyanin/azurin family copper-binding protein, partial [Verrucomicrobiae bacterium]|nr:plastocyanin/azurin family copper-binding protein [Verrucomicrobiae bacterium]
KWSAGHAGPAVDGILAWCGGVPVTDRGEPDFIEAAQVASDLASLLPKPEAAAARKELHALRVSSFVVRTVREQMRYDTPRLVVEAGKPFQIIFENDDFMPHNLVVTGPGARENVGMASATMKPGELDSEQRAYIPKGVEGIMGATRLLQTGERETIKLTAPAAPCVCDYICTFPGHYQLMWGRLIVAKDVDAYLTAHPVASRPTPTSASGASSAMHHHHQFE